MAHFKLLLILLSFILQFLGDNLTALPGKLFEKFSARQGSHVFSIASPRDRLKALIGYSFNYDGNSLCYEFLKCGIPKNKKQARVFVTMKFVVPYVQPAKCKKCAGHVHFFIWKSGEICMSAVSSYSYLSC